MGHKAVDVNAGDQTALVAALGRSDVPVRWLHPRFNVMLTLPFSYVESSCGEDATYARHAAAGGQPGAPPVSFAHFVWAPKPWMAAMTKVNALARDKRRNAVQADAPFANEHVEPSRNLARRVWLCHGRPRGRHSHANAAKISQSGRDADIP